jgi:hypothetical protein
MAFDANFFGADEGEVFVEVAMPDVASIPQ